MALWLIRAGADGEFERKFLKDQRVYVCWDGLNTDISRMTERQQLIDALIEIYPEGKINTFRNWASQIWPFCHQMNVGDLVVLPSKLQQAVYVGEIRSDYQFAPNGPNPYFHWRSVEWVSEPVPRTHFGQDLLYSFGAFMTICRVQRNNAEGRVRAMGASGWQPEKLGDVIPKDDIEAVDQNQTSTDLEELGRDQIAQVISARFKGHQLTRLVEGILKAQGYTTYRSPDGPDGGIDILAGTGPLGFGQPRLCVQVKSQETPVEARAINELRGAMQNVNATEGLFVSWGGYKGSVYRSEASNFFSIRLWTQRELLEALFQHYDNLDEEIRTSLPLKRIWTVAEGEE